MSTSLPVRSHPASAESSYSRGEVIAAIQDFYELLIKLPYIEPNALVLPPSEGWSGVNAQKLRDRGKTEEVIELLRYLPYLRAPAPGKRWMIGPDTIMIAYCDGEVYDEINDSLQPVPGHCIWLTDYESRDGTSLLFDTHTDTITEWTSLGHHIMIDYEEYENIPTQDKWMAHPTMPAAAFFRLWKQNFEKLVWMAFYNPRGSAGTAQWCISSATLQEEEEDRLASDDDFEPDADEQGDDEEGGSEPDGEDDMDDEDGLIPDEELDELMEDAYGEEAPQRRIDLQSEKNTAEYKPVDLPPPELAEPADQRLLHIMIRERKTKEVYEIYTRNGWPSNFDRENCKVMLADFCEREEGPINRLR
ncbi:hypothetical protein HO173_005997 [Letharia columbiana]|uniref:Uncharacterized protein n=1 Tax=Letharia columbiana TaxID=112416 RepID=A0A8H6FW49_9LECA|nr:uncharacterized protein HO173_005997 [Letharia columbiana]KAF6235802.1 hypothetical protein HO173_005997 [Letharia columbiana]